MTKLKSPE